MNQNDYLPTRHSLIHRLKNWEDQASWQDFFDTYWRFIYGVAMKAGLREAEAQDVVQDTVISVAKKIKDFQVGSTHGSFKAWLVHTTRWRIADQFRKRKLVVESIEASEATSRTGLVERMPDPASLEPDAAWDQDWEENLLTVALERLAGQTENQAFQLFQLHVIKKWPATKVAQTTGAKLAQVYFAKYKLSRLLKREIARLQRDLI